MKNLNRLSLALVLTLALILISAKIIERDRKRAEWAQCVANSDYTDGALTNCDIKFGDD